jgi:hypothetical protein
MALSCQLFGKLLSRNGCQSCALSLSLFTDGSPSDFMNGGKPSKAYDKDIAKMIGTIAQKYGSRLSFTIVAIGDKQDFPLLNKMIQRAKDYRSKAYLMRPSMSLSDFGTAVSSISSSVTQSQREMTDMDTLQQRKDRTILRETQSQARQRIKSVDPMNFRIVPLERVKRAEYKEWYVDRARHSEFEVMPLQHPDAAFVAVCHKSFGEGGERFAFHFYEIAADGRTIVGIPTVAKERRHVLESEEGNDESVARARFVKKFCTGQQFARRLANEFNEKLDNLHRVDPLTPRVSFLDCSVYELESNTGKKQSMLVEERLNELKWHKWNANNGYVEGMQSVPDFSAEQLRDAMANHAHLDLIREDSEDEDDSNQEEDGINNNNSSYCQPASDGAKVFTASEVAQAFSHFTYWKSGRKRLVCDLQGVYDEELNVLKLSDPVIHYHNDFHRGHSRRYGNTDRGRKGMAMFFATHHEHCGHLCKLVMRGLRPQRVH